MRSQFDGTRDAVTCDRSIGPTQRNRHDYGRTSSLSGARLLAPRGPQSLSVPPPFVSAAAFSCETASIELVLDGRPSLISRGSARALVVRRNTRCFRHHCPQKIRVAAQW